MVTSYSSVLKSGRRIRSMVCSRSVCGCPAKSNQNLSLKPIVSIASVSPSNVPFERHLQRPGLHRERVTWLDGLVDVVDEFAVGVPNPGKIHPAVGGARHDR